MASAHTAPVGAPAVNMAAPTATEEPSVSEEVYSFPPVSLIADEKALEEESCSSEDEGGPRRVSFRTDEVESKEIASLLQADFDESGDDDDDEQEDDDEEIEEDVAEREATSNFSSGSPASTQLSAEPQTVIEEESDDEENTNRGLELKTCKERQQRKFLILKCVLKCQEQYNGDQLANVSRICNKWAQEAARIQGAIDYEEVYRCYKPNQIKKEIPNMSLYPLPLKRKQPSSSATEKDNDNTRRVRARTAES